MKKGIPAEKRFLMAWCCHKLLANVLFDEDKAGAQQRGCNSERTERHLTRDAPPDSAILPGAELSSISHKPNELLTVSS
ncbi:Hypothetical predicted protein [Marmota monax]|uniref:Uncharacterized protein n=1 Tax=Marmota monax TaxID=9995 RepID=A0A5E4BFZ0_MARMO|nr:hypothetical protein GHT09_012687 [Marmota monax]VTJ68186.1 Hypothetical predicted protein [Marmota monax]